MGYVAAGTRTMWRWTRCLAVGLAIGGTALLASALNPAGATLGAHKPSVSLIDQYTYGVSIYVVNRQDSGFHSPNLKLEGEFQQSAAKCTSGDNWHQTLTRHDRTPKAVGVFKVDESSDRGCLWPRAVAQYTILINNDRTTLKITQTVGHRFITSCTDTSTIITECGFEPAKDGSNPKVNVSFLTR